MSLIETGHKEQTEFLYEWPVERLENVILQNYNHLGKETAFTYWLEFRINHTGGIGEGRALKIVIFKKRANSSDRNDDYLMTDGTYTWPTR